MKVTITWSTWMVGKWVLLECLEDNNITEILLINRNPIDIQHTKITEILHQDFTNFEAIADYVQWSDAVFWCMGVSSMWMSKQKYEEITYGSVKSYIDTLDNKEQTVFIYVSGEWTDETEDSSMARANIKWKTENLIKNHGFKDVYLFRPWVILPQKWVKSKTRWVNILYTILKPVLFLIPKTTTVNIWQAMIHLAQNRQIKKTLRNKDIDLVVR